MMTPSFREFQKLHRFNLNARIENAVYRFFDTARWDTYLERDKYHALSCVGLDSSAREKISTAIIDGLPVFIPKEHSEIFGYIHNQILEISQRIAESGLNMVHAAIDMIERLDADEHGGWQRMIEMDRKGRGTAINTSIYGYDKQQHLGVIQVRRFDRERRNRILLQKTFFLIGYNENGNPFAHALSARKMNQVLRVLNPSPQRVVDEALAWIWQVPISHLSTILRNGDTGLLPLSQSFKPSTGWTRIQVLDSHYCDCDSMTMRGSSRLVLNPTLWHAKEQHPAVSGEGWYKVLIGRRGKFYDFARPTVD